jgi:hypothetical protein
MRESLLSRYLITASERVNLVTRHLRGEVNRPSIENPTGQDKPDKESLNVDLLIALLKGLESETQILKQE